MTLHTAPLSKKKSMDSGSDQYNGNDGRGQQSEDYYSVYSTLKFLSFHYIAHRIFPTGTKAYSCSP